MKVLEVIATLQLGGAEVLVKEMAPRLCQQGFDVTVAVLKATGSPLERELVNSGVRLIETAKASYYSPIHLPPLVQLSQGYDIVHTHLFPPQLWGALASMVPAGNGQPAFVTTEHSTHNRRRTPLFNTLDRWLYSRYHSVVCISDAVASALTQWVPNVAEKVRVIPNGIPLEDYSSATPLSASDLLAGSAGPIIVCTGRFEPEKGHDVLLRALALLPDAHAVLLGDGPLRLDLARLAESLQISNRVHFLGRRRDVPRILKAADVYVQPSRWEGFGLATTEAMSSGAPVVASDVPGLADVVGQGGLLVPPGDHIALANAIRSVLASPNLRRRLSNAAVEQAGRYSINSTVNAHAELYRSLAQTNH